MRGFLLDSSYLFALYREEGHRTRAASESFRELFYRSGNVLLVLWPILYESFNTEFSSDRRQVLRLQSEWRRLLELKRLIYLDDAPYRETSRDQWWARIPTRSTKRSRGLSLVDTVLMSVMDDRELGVEAVLTFDLRDFSGILCEKENRDHTGW
jgi:predicted nucleic acid-binding protein